MVHKESELLSLNEKYTLDKYEFTLKTREIPQTNLMDVIATATGPNGKMGAKTMQVPKTAEIEGWYVEANDKTADVYVAVKYKSELTQPVYLEELELGSIYMGHEGDTAYYYVSALTATSPIYAIRFPWLHMENQIEGMFISLEPFSGQTRRTAPMGWDPHIENFQSLKVEVDDYVGYIAKHAYGNGITWNVPKSADQKETHNNSQWAVIALHEGQHDEEEKDELIGRFEIDIRLAGGTEGNGGTENGWTDPEDGQPTLWPGDEGYPDPEDPDYPGDGEPYYPPSKTLYLEVEGALSGRHNDPLHDTSYSYVPADKATVKPYGYGGDGGHGGGGGAGSSTVVVYKFGTDKADSKEIIVKPKRHGYGSGGGKGGKGGDGCILIYY